MSEGYRRDESARRRGRATRAALILCVSFALAVSAGAEELERAAPVVAPPSGELTYDIPLPAWLVDAVTELKLEFAEGLAAETVALADERMAGDVGSLTETVNELAAVGQRIDATMSRMGNIDSSFGISGLSQLLTADGAVRDTLFGFVVWHESAQGPSRKIASDLERTVDRMVELGRSAKTQAGQLSGGARQMDEALTRKDYATIVSSSAAMTRSTDDLAGLAAATEEAATGLEKVVWQIRDDGSTSLEDHWGQVLLDTSEARRLVAKMEPSVASMKTSAGLLAGMAGALQVVVQAPSLMTSTAPDAAGSYHIPWAVFQNDVEIAANVNEGFLGGTDEEYPQSARASVQSLLGKMVTADRLLAERAVEYTSTEVGRAVDRLEDRYKKAVGLTENATDRQREEALQKVDVALRGNRDLDAARVSARAARATLDDGKAKEEQGHGSEVEALTQYRNAWAHALNAGAAAAKALGAATSK